MVEMAILLFFGPPSPSLEGRFYCSVREGRMISLVLAAAANVNRMQSHGNLQVKA